MILMAVSGLYNCFGFFHSPSVHIMVHLINPLLVGVYKCINGLFNSRVLNYMFVVVHDYCMVLIFLFLVNSVELCSVL
jgi:hypothetical protein